MKWRNFLRFLGCVASWALAARARHPTKRPVIGVLSPFIDADSTFLRDLRQGLGDRGLRAGQEIAIEYRSAEGRINQLPVLADELVRLKVDIIVTASAPAIRFVQQATLNIPIALMQLADSVDQAFVATFPHPTPT